MLVLLVVGAVVTVIVLKQRKKKKDKDEEEELLYELDGTSEDEQHNLRRRKLRTFLTVLGVVIGTASIVVMVSLGLGMQKSMYQEIEQYGGLTTIKVYGAGSEDMMGYSMGGEDQEASEEYVDDHCIETLGKIEHVESAQPVYQMSVLLLKGSYEGYTEAAGYDTGRTKEPED